jgi:hypothetical protein
MPRLSVWFVRASLLHLALGFSFGALMLWNKGLLTHPLAWRLLPAHMELLLVGWMVQLALGVAFWILPRFGTRRGNVRLAWTAFWLLNLGVLLAGLGPVVGAPPRLVLLGRALQAAGAAAFALHAWPRVKPANI